MPFPCHCGLIFTSENAKDKHWLLTHQSPHSTPSISPISTKTDSISSDSLESSITSTVTCWSETSTSPATSETSTLFQASPSYSTPSILPNSTDNDSISSDSMDSSITSTVSWSQTSTAPATSDNRSSLSVRSRSSSSPYSSSSPTPSRFMKSFKKQSNHSMELRSHISAASSSFSRPASYRPASTLSASTQLQTEGGVIYIDTSNTDTSPPKSSPTNSPCPDIIHIHDSDSSSDQ